MSRTLERIRDLVARGEIQISEHGYDELAQDDIFVYEILAGVADAVVVEDYPDYHRGPCVLVLQRDGRKECQFMSFGVFPRPHLHQPSW